MPPIDPSIILNARPAAPITVADPMDRYAKVVGLQAAMGQQDVQGLQLQQLRQGMEDDQALRSATMEAGGDNARLRALLQGRGQHKALRELDKADLERRGKEATIVKDAAQGAKAAWEVEKDKLQQGAAMLDLAKDQQSFESVLRLGQMNGIFKPEVVAQLLQQGFRPKLVETLKNAGITRAQQLEEQNRVAVRAETGRHNVATEGNTRRGQDMTLQGTREGHGVTVRGQNLTDARQREANAVTREGQQTQIINDPVQGPILINKGTGIARPAISATTGQPVPGEIPAKAAANAGDVQMLLREAENNIKSATGSYAGAAYDQLSRIFGSAPKGAIAIGNLKAIEGALLSKMPRMEGPQSNLDVQAYREAVGSIGDPTIPNEQKAAAVTTVKRIQERYAKGVAGARGGATGDFGAPGSGVNPSNLSDAELLREIGR